MATSLEMDGNMSSSRVGGFNGEGLVVLEKKWAAGTTSYILKKNKNHN